MHDSDVDVRVSIMSYSDNVEWMYDEPVSVDEFELKKLKSGKWSKMNLALEELNKKMNAYTGSDSDTPPLILFLSDGYSNPGYSEILEDMKRNNDAFRSAYRISIAVGDDLNRTTLLEFASDSNMVLTSDDLNGQTSDDPLGPTSDDPLGLTSLLKELESGIEGKHMADLVCVTQNDVVSF